MARLDVYRLPDGHVVADCQADILSHLGTRLVVPLMPAGQGPTPLTRLNPTVTIGGGQLVFYADLAAAVPVRELGEPIGSLADQDYTVLAALDMLITGI